MRDANPGEDEEAGVDRDLVEVSGPFFSIPSQLSIPCADMAGSRTKADAGDRPVVGEGDIFEVFADGLGKAEVVMFPYKPLIESF